MMGLFYKIHIAHLTDAADVGKNGSVGGAALLRNFSEKEIDFVIIWIIGVWDRKDSNKLCS